AAIPVRPIKAIKGRGDVLGVKTWKGMEKCTLHVIPQKMKLFGDAQIDEEEKNERMAMRVLERFMGE
ncbi:hypothetical protein WUBG_14691, partial [Wuchereria bancrofti]